MHVDLFYSEPRYAEIYVSRLFRIREPEMLRVSHMGSKWRPGLVVLHWICNQEIRCSNPVTAHQSLSNICEHGICIKFLHVFSGSMMWNYEICFDLDVN